MNLCDSRQTEHATPTLHYDTRTALGIAIRASTWQSGTCVMSANVPIPCHVTLSVIIASVLSSRHSGRFALWFCLDPLWLKQRLGRAPGRRERSRRRAPVGQPKLQGGMDVPPMQALDASGSDLPQGLWHREPEHRRQDWR